jgi:hypothetical protein
MRHLRENSGQSLVELIMAIVIIEVGLFSVWSMFLVNYNSEREAQMRIVGANLAREGVELVKNVRDSNWLKVNANVTTTDGSLWSWDQGLDSGKYEFDATNIIEEGDKKVTGDKFVKLYLNDDGLYNTDVSDKPTAYQRAITLKDICCTSADVSCNDTNYSISATGCSGTQLKIGLNVVSEVSWVISGNSRSFTAELNLYNWQ